MLSVFHAQPFFPYVMCVFTLMLLQCCLSVPSRMRAEGYCSCRVCVCICYRSSYFSVRLYSQAAIHTG